MRTYSYSSSLAFMQIRLHTTKHSSLCFSFTLLTSRGLDDYEYEYHRVPHRKQKAETKSELLFEQECAKLQIDFLYETRNAFPDSPFKPQCVPRLGDLLQSNECR